MTDSRQILTARDIMTSSVISFSPHTPIFKAIRTLIAKGISGVPVVDSEDGVVGVLSELDCLRMLSSDEFYADQQEGDGAVRDFMTSAGKTIPPTMGIYGIAKAGVEMMTKVLASELAGFNIQVNAVAPAMVQTKFSEPFWSNDELLAHITKTIPMGRIAQIEDVVRPVLFLASQGSSFITGQTIMVDGGTSAV
jgi:NAD(P)-dependent dehydrogenase (short-subunit alcohol dehydrogenase family)